ncbi:Trimeric intracellular cation channel type B [Galemys pyrenaicus]|uniref:Trimeric intracellular cation channel type B n=1 Tax=Galemys pyrenaicus TaxID=202257 RepID=A0A8J6DJM2_GALPY|nr:Trimeric intracellular cation channel type B [Galemys pyrenaicus]
MSSPWDELTLAFSRTSMFPFFDIAHYLVSVMALKHQPGAGGSIITNFERLVKGGWKPEADEWLKMSYPAKITLLGSIIFTFQQTKHLSVTRHNLMFFYTVFLVATKISMMITESSTTFFAPFEDALSRMLFGRQQQFASPEKKSETKSSFNGTGSSSSKAAADASDKVKKKHTKKTE